MRTLSVVNQKGGVGKTTTVLNLSHALELLGYRVLAIDLDPQSHLTDSFGMHGYRGGGADEVLLEGADIGAYINEISENLHFLPAGNRLGQYENVNKTLENSKRLKAALALANEYDFVLIDCPPSAGVLAMSALIASDELIAPVSSDYLSLHGLARMLSAVSHIDAVLKLSLKKWVLMTRFNSSRRLANDVLDRVNTHFPKQLLKTVVRENVALAESPSYGASIFGYKKSSTGAVDYLKLANELVELSENNLMRPEANLLREKVSQVTHIASA